MHTQRIQARASATTGDSSRQARRCPCAIFLLLASLCLPPIQADPAWRLSWSDEFNLPNGSLPSDANWTYNTGNNNGWGNNELEYYLYKNTQTSRIQDGCLVIEAHRTNYTANNVTYNYVSARLKTESKFNTTYGRIEARIQLPSGSGLWPAFWMVGANIATAPWPACGEIDIMENVGTEPYLIHGSAHGTGYSGSKGLTSSVQVPSLASSFHIYAIEWQTNRVRWLVDNQVYFQITPASLPVGTTWAFDHPFFIVLNLAIGGWGGDPTRTQFPKQMLVDYVRVYFRVDAPPPALSLVESTNNDYQAAWSARYPHATLQHATKISQPWTNHPGATSVSSQLFRVLVDPGFYRLSILPQ